MANCNIELGINAKGEITVNPIDQDVHQEDTVSFFTLNPYIIFGININNSNNFFTDPGATIKCEVSFQSSSPSYIINNPTRNLVLDLPKNYDVSIVKIIVPSITKVAPKIILKP